MSRPLRSFPQFNLLVIGGLIVVLQIPLSMIRGVISEREYHRGAAIDEVTKSWGGEQIVDGPRLVVPIVAAESDSTTRELTILPASLSIDGEVLASPLRRGLFTVPAYRASLRLSGHFQDVGRYAGASDELDWSNAALAVWVFDPRSIGGGSGARWAGEDRELMPGKPDESGGATVLIPVTASPEGAADFEVTLELSGSRGLHFTPLGEHTDVAIRSDWPSPSFTGSWLPRDRSVSEDGFTADWSVSYLGRGYPQSWTEQEDVAGIAVHQSRFGVDFITPVDPYRMSERSTKYAALFMVFTFGLLWLFQVMGGVRLHGVHYLLVGVAMCLFYLLQLALAEHIGFASAYVLSASAIAALVAGYGKAVLQSTARAGSLGGSMALVYGYLFALLALEQYALLAGSLGLFVGLAAVMYGTRWIDWDAIGGSGPEETSTPTPSAAGAATQA